jgi:hypothetical protein
MTVLNTTCTTELEAVNLMLSSIGESSIASIDDPQDPDALAAIQMLSEANRRTQNIGWNFNTDQNKLTTRTIAGYIMVGGNVLAIDSAGCDKDRDVVQRGDKLWDRDNNTFVFDRDLYLDITYLMDFETLPQAARDVIVEDAGLQFQAASVGSEVLYKFTTDRLFRCTRILRRDHTKSRDPNVLTDNWHAARVVLGRMGGPLRP